MPADQTEQKASRPLAFLMILFVGLASLLLVAKTIMELEGMQLHLLFTIGSLAWSALLLRLYRFPPVRPRFSVRRVVGLVCISLTPLAAFLGVLFDIMYDSEQCSDVPASFDCNPGPDPLVWLGMLASP